MKGWYWCPSCSGKGTYLDQTVGVVLCSQQPEIPPAPVLNSGVGEELVRVIQENATLLGYHLDKATLALERILAVTSRTYTDKSRTYTALSEISVLAREGLK